MEKINNGKNRPATRSHDGDSKEKIPWYKGIWERDRLLIFIIFAVTCGLIMGLSINASIQKLEEPTRSTVLILLGFPGEILMRMLKMLILPLIMTSLIVGLAELDQKSSGRLGRRAVLYYLFTTFIAVVIGIILTVSISPGNRSSKEEIEPNDNVKTRTMDTILDLIRNMFPENIIQACFEQSQTPATEMTIKTPRCIVVQNSTNSSYEKNVQLKICNSTHNVSVINTTKTILLAGKTVYKSGTNIIGIVTFSIVFGIVLGQLGSKVKDLTILVSNLGEVIMQIVNYVMWYSPIGLWSLVISKFAKMENISETFESLGLYIATVVCGLAIHSIVILPTIYVVTTRKNPFLYIKGTMQALLTAFGTSSSSATLPITFKCLEVNNNVDKRVSRFVLPIGATMNMDGTALYEAVAAIFIAQSVGLELSASQYIGISLTSILASIGAAGIPQAGLITMLMVLQTVGLPEEAVSLILPVDWFLDRIRTTVNVLGDCIGAGIVDHLSQGDVCITTALKKNDNEKDEADDNLDSNSVVMNYGTLQIDNTNL